MRCFNHKNNHIFKLKECWLKFPTMTLDNLLQQMYLYIKYQQNKRKEGNYKYLQLVNFWHPSNHSNNGGQMHNWVEKTLNLFDMLMR
jgi:hypothetical protein